MIDGSFEPIRPELVPAHEDTCPAHGPYTSNWLNVRAGGEWLGWWTGCPTCIRQHHQAKYGQGRPDLRAPHRPRED
jgi:hypothetical protein